MAAGAQGRARRSAVDHPRRGMSAMLEARGLTRILPGPPPTTLVADIAASFERGSFTAVTGPSGSGKSSLLYLLGLLDPPTSGDVLLDGVSTRWLPNEARGRVRLEQFGFVFQFHFLLPELTALDNVMLPMRQLARLSPSSMRERARWLLASLDMEAEAKKIPAALSGGQRQRVAIARALANDPRLVLADEPTGALDTKNGAAVVAIFRRLADEGRTVIVVTHDEGLAHHAERAIHIVDGRIARQPVFQS
jgi:lipoprotein-releasing system ATP-binding protein